MTIYEAINALLQYGEDKEIYEVDDKEYILNSLLATLNLDDYVQNDFIYNNSIELSDIINNIINYAIANNIIEDTQINRDLFDTKIMGCLTPMPSMINKKFNELKEKSPELATEYFYNLSKNIDYVRTKRIAKNIPMNYESEYGKIDMTINLSKPEKDPNDIKKLLTIKQVSYPTCMLCKENVNYKGRLNFPARQTLRFVPIILDNKKFYMQYSPYSYYDEHTICFKDEHSNMKVDIDAIKEITSFVEQFPHYFMGSNAGLPIVGGSILNHHHFQGGNAILPMQNAKEEFIKEDNNVSYSLLNWPMNVIRLKSKNKNDLILAAKRVMDFWDNYENKDLMIIAKDETGMHNAITPICRYKDGNFELDLALRNNITTKERPLGLYHPREEYWNIKKENIGLIEVMGLAILPARLKDEIQIIKKYLLNEILTDADLSSLQTHLNFANQIKKNQTYSKENVDKVITDAIGDTFVKILEDCAPFKHDSINILKECIKEI